MPQEIARLTLLNKIDVAGLPARRVEGADAGGTAAAAGTVIYLSAKTGAGLDLLRSELKRHAGLEGAGEDVILARTRHVEALTRAVQCVDVAIPHLDPAAPALELFAEELRLAQEALNTITGEFTPDDLLGEIFGRFCIGK